MIVKKVQARHIQMSCNFARSFLWSNNDSPPNMSSCNSSMWAQLQTLVSGQIFSLRSNNILYWFNGTETLPGQASTYINYSQQVLPQLVDPITLCNFSKFLSRMKLCEASATLVFPNSMKFLQKLHIIIKPLSAKFQLTEIKYVSASSKSPILASFALSTATTI